MNSEAPETGFLTVETFYKIFNARGCSCPKSEYQLLATMKYANGSALNMNSTADQRVVLGGGTTFAIKAILFSSPTIALTTADDGQLWTGLGRTGDGSSMPVYAVNILTASNTTYSPPTPFILANGIGSEVSVGNTLYFSLGVPQGVQSYVDAYFFGYILS